MTPLREYAEHWFKHTALRVGHPNWLKLNARWVRDVADARPGFTAELREVALEALRASDRELVHRALAALAVVGTVTDLPTVDPFASSDDTYVAGAARTAAFEIQHRAA